MNSEDIRNYCLSLKGTTEDIKWENHLCFSVGEKMYLILATDHFPVSASFKTSDELFDELPAREGLIPAPYMARHKWVHIDNIDRLSKKEWKMLIDTAYQKVFDKLSVKLQRSIMEPKVKAKSKKRK